MSEQRLIEEELLNYIRKHTRDELESYAMNIIKVKQFDGASPLDLNKDDLIELIFTYREEELGGGTIPQIPSMVVNESEIDNRLSSRSIKTLKRDLKLRGHSRGVPKTKRGLISKTSGVLTRDTCDPRIGKECGVGKSCEISNVPGICMDESILHRSKMPYMNVGSKKYYGVTDSIDEYASEMPEESYVSGRSPRRQFRSPLKTTSRIVSSETPSVGAPIITHSGPATIVPPTIGVLQPSPEIIPPGLEVFTPSTPRNIEEVSKESRFAENLPIVKKFNALNLDLEGMFKIVASSTVIEKDTADKIIRLENQLMGCLGLLD